jgi:hypothetical protein
MILFRSRRDRPNVLKVYGCASLLAVKRPAEQIIGLAESQCISAEPG